MAGSSEKQVVVIGIDDSEQSTYALKWTLDHFFPSPIFKLVLVHSRPTATSAVGLAGPGTSLLLLTSLSHLCLIQFRTPSLVYVGAAEILPIVDSDLRKIAARVVDSAKQLCIEKSVISFLTFSYHL